MSSDEEIKDIGEVECPECHNRITVMKRVVYDRPHKRKKISEELFAEKTVQATF